MGEEIVEKLPNLELANWKFLLTQPQEVCPNKNEIKQKLMEAIVADSKHFAMKV
jgi:hypothetical protein